MSYRFVFLSALTAVGCGGSSPPHAPPPSLSSAEPPPAFVPPPPSAGASVSAPAGAQPGLPQPTFYVVNETSQPLSLLKAGDVTLATAGPIFSKLDDAGIEQDELLSKGLPQHFFAPVTGVAGRFPDALWATVIQSNGRTGWGELYRRGKQGWARVGGALPQTRVHVGIGDWSEGRVLTLQGSMMGLPPPPLFSFRIVSGPPAPLPVLSKPPAGLSGEAGEQCRHWGTHIVPEQLGVLTSGHVLVSGRTCTQDGFGVERWDPGQTRGTPHVFPASADFWPVKLLMRSARNVALLVSTKEQTLLLRLEGSSWTSEPLELEGQASDADLTEDGTLFVVSRAFDAKRRQPLPGRLWWRPAGQAKLSELMVPAREAPERWSSQFNGVTAVSATSRDDVWVVAGDALLHSRPAAGGPRKIEWAGGQQFPGSLRMPKAAGAGCEHVFVLLYGITKTTPPDYDFPLTRKALAGHTEFQGVTLAETEDNGRRFFGAFVQSFEQGQRLSKLVQAQVPGSIPAVLCAEPQRVREVAIDWKTGVLR